MATTTAEQRRDPTAGGTAAGGATAGDGERPKAGRVHVGELISTVSALVLLVLLFAFQWYGVAGVPDPSYARPAVSGTEDGWNGLPLTRWVLLVTIIAVLGSLLLHASQRAHGARTDTSRLITILGTLSSALLIYRVLIALPGNGIVIDQKLGAVLGLLAGLGVAWGGYESIREQRARAGVPAARRLRRRGSGAHEHPPPDVERP
ncbi:MAG TPA: hypothetical protein VE127_06100 [Solirubrobacteraceae bacterium]|nr:hypothetical protein [Solirubrobacteraceae bacterium]